MNYEYRNDLMFRFNGGLTPAVKAFLLVNGIAFLLQLILPVSLWRIFVLSRTGIARGMIWQFFTYMFLHSPGSLLHILFNMLILFMIGPETERGLGTRPFTLMYLASGIAGGLMWVLFSAAPCIGASGAVYGVLGAFAALWPNRQMTLLIFFVLPVTLKAWVLVCGLAILAFLSSVGGTQDQIAHPVHLVGIAVGVGFTYWFTRRNGRIRFGRPIPRLRVIRGGRPGPADHPSEIHEAYVDPRTVDTLLDKISEQGVGSLTRQERAMLEAASRQRRSGR